jgi:hypothetical protein
MPRRTSLDTIVALVAIPIFLSFSFADEDKGDRTVKAHVQMRPGGEREEVEMPVWEVPVDPRSVTAAEADLPDDDLVLGVVVGDRAMAWPIRFLALSEVVDDRVGETALAPTW